MRQAHGFARPQRGVGLIEVLVAMLVLSFGFLVTANMQLKGMAANQDSYYQAQALMLANEMMDRMRNNRVGVANNHYDGYTTNNSETLPDCVSSGCGVADIASLDKFEWSANLHPLRNQSEDSFIPMLPVSSENASATGTISALADGVYQITMTWMRLVDKVETAQTLTVRFVP